MLESVHNLFKVHHLSFLLNYSNGIQKTNYRKDIHQKIIFQHYTLSRVKIVNLYKSSAFQAFKS